MAALAERGRVSIGKFLRWNDVEVDRIAAEGEFFYLQPKHRRMVGGAHVVSGRETVWSLSQRYGVRVRYIRKLNPELPEGLLKPGTTVVMDKSRGGSSPSAVSLDAGSPFEWSGGKN